MSTGLNCEIVQVPNLGFYYILEHGDAPKQAWNWREYASAYGPFKTEEDAEDHLHRHHANPGGCDFVGVIDPEKEVYKELLSKAGYQTVYLRSRR